MLTRLCPAAVALVVGLTACGDDPAEPKDPAPPEVDAGTAQDARVTDTGATKPSDTGTPAPSTDPTLAALAGRYLLRFDNFGTAMASGFTIRSRVSVLVTADLAVDGGQLAAKERVCNQTVFQECKAGCKASTTVVDPKAISDFLIKRTFARSYTVDGASFRAGKAVFALGYDDPADGNAPDQPTDARVWDVVKGEPREGLLTKITVTPPAPLPEISCSAYGTQKFVSQFSGALSGSGASVSFPAGALEPELDGSDAKSLGFDYPVVCAPQGDPTSTAESATVRIVRFGNALGAGETWECPSVADFDSKLPGGAL